MAAMNLATFLVFAASCIPVLVLVVAVTLDRKRRKAIEKPPQQEKLLRPPGYSLSIRFDESQDAFINAMLMACLLCALAGASGLSLAGFLGARVPVWWSAVAGVVFAGFAFAGIAMVIRAFRRLREAHHILLGLRGEQAVAETLHEVADYEFRIFHDLPGTKIKVRTGAREWNIDHVAVGPRDVFAVETKARSRRPSQGIQPDHVVVYDGKTLRFPSGTYDVDAVAQAESNARDLGEFLSRHTAEEVTVEPLLILPGWYVETKGNFAVKVMNATYLAGYLRGQRERVQPTQVRRILALLDEKCRDVEF